MSENRSGGNEILPLMLGIVFVLAMVGAIWLFATGESAASATEPKDDYGRAVLLTVRPEVALESHTLYRFDHTTTFVTWTKEKYVSSYQGPQATAKTDVWVTDAASMRNFCRDFVRTHGADPDKLAMRIRQRLGLPPDAADDTFVELSIDPKSKGGFFRPCGDMSPQLLDQTSCAPPKDLPGESSVWGPNPTKSTDDQEWILRKYHATYTTEPQYPWTGLGYTFDWARSEDGSDNFVRWGQSEFVIPNGDPVHFVSATPTAAYCAP